MQNNTNNHVLYVNGVKTFESVDFQTVMRMAEKEIQNGNGIIIKSKDGSKSKEVKK